MPWSETTPMDQKMQFIADYLRGELGMTELCELYGIARKTGYKFVERYLSAGPEALEERSRKPRNHPNQTPEHIVHAILEMRRRHPSWGAKKLLPLLEKHHPRWDLPSRTTVSDCYRLTVTDGFSRFLLGCQGLHSTMVAEAKPVFTRLFKEYGLPKRIRTDNGVPFATNTLARLSSLSAWWVRLGILPELIEPGKPQQNGRHERMHRTLKDETTRPAAASLAAQQRKFNVFREEFNHERPHEALDQQTPASCYRASAREMPEKIPALQYPDRFEVRYVSANGGIRWNRGWINVSTVCIGEYVGLEEIDNGIWNVYFGALKLGRLIERHLKIEDAFGRLSRHHA